MHKIELLAPARTAEVGIEAFQHGADAVYIGSPAFSARAAAGNSVADIERLAAFGHQYGAKTIVALNTILTDNELPQAERLSWQLYEAGVDALIVQDLGLLQLQLPPIELHASTQTDNRTIEKVRLMRQLGMTRVVMARELSVDQIRAIHEAVPDVEIECFVHGALCVCISGQCYLSAALTGRSANRGECAQPCRLPMDLLSPDGRRVVASQRHLLSLRDMNRSAYIEQLIDAGVTSLKIEGRLKEASYVKNVVAYYRQLIDRLIEKRPDFFPLSQGHCIYTFEPRLEKSFNRGFTSYFAENKREPMWNFDSPKSMGESVGRIERIGRDYFILDSQTKLNNGDGLAVGSIGFRLNRYDPTTRACYPLDGLKVCQSLRKGMSVFRNLDIAFEQLLSKPSAKRKIPVQMHFSASRDEIALRVKVIDDCRDGLANLQDEVSKRKVTLADLQDEVSERKVAPADLQDEVSGLKVAPANLQDEVSGLKVAPVDLQGHADVCGVASAKLQLEPAERDQTENIRKQLSKLGDTIFQAEEITVEGGEWFIPSSKLAELRRVAIADLQEQREKMLCELRKSFCAPDYAKLAGRVEASGILPEDFLANVLNGKARKTYASMGLENVDDAFEIQSNKEGMVMQTKHCLKYAFGQCPKYTNPHPEKLLDSTLKIGQEMQLKIGNRKFILKFGCKNDCLSKIFTIFAPQNK